MRITRCLTGLLVLLTMLLAGCQGGVGGGTNVTQGSPAGMTERDESVVYAEGQEIIPDTPSSSGGTITQYSVSPPLPAGLSLNPLTGAITGTPTAVSKATICTITGSNAQGSTTTLVEIEVKATAIAPDSLSYLDDSIIYVTNAAITPNMPIASGGEITQYSVSPALPAGLVLDPQTGIISGTPVTVTPSAVYTVTGSNSVDSVQAQVTIEVQAQIAPPAGLTYMDPVPVYTIGRPIEDNDPLYSGGEITGFSVSPTLPAGLSIDAQTGQISGTPTTTQAQTTFVVTGSNSAGSVTAQVAITVATSVIGEWLPADAMNLGRYEHTATLLPNGKVLVVAGYNKRALTSAELYDPASDTWSQTGNLVVPRDLHTATLLPNGKVLVVGGYNNGGGSSQSSAELYDPATGTWSQTGSMSQARDSHTATLLPNGKVLVAGGEGNAGLLSSAELYDPATGTWSQTGNLVVARQQHTATLLPNGKVLVAGGAGSGGRLSSAELYDPATGTWSQTGSMGQVRNIYAATLLPDGKVLAAGGYNGTAALSTAELYDPATGTWSQTGSMSQARYYLTATLVPDGRVLVAGGGAKGTLASDELYDPATGTWSRTGSLLQPRYKHTATLLPDGRVLAAGGTSSNGTLSSAELFH
ncbi:Kelch repeat-containing protein [Paraburkholderia sp. 35.1]|uniref:Kelch repeat-containing protein n=1 Tax=Paraburkholderia sp. 35.1 TaxID=2991058 RepID=UPI003D1F55E6